MGILMTILGIMNSAKAMSRGDRLGGALGVLGSLSQSGLFSSGPTESGVSNFMSDAGVRRNYL